MKRYTVFYAGMPYGEYDFDEWPGTNQLPDGAYILYTSHEKVQAWDIVRFCSRTPINLSDVPKELRVLALLMT